MYTGGAGGERLRPYRISHRRYGLRRCLLSQSRCIWAVASALAASSAIEVRAQQATAERFVAAPVQPGAIISLWGSRPQRAATYTLSVSLNRCTVEETDSGGDASAAVSTFDVQSTIGLWDSFDLTAALALHRMPSHELPGGEESGPRSSLGDARVTPRLQVFGGDAKAGLAILLPTWIPAGEGSRYAAYGIRLQPTLASQVELEYFTFTANVGYLLHPARHGWGSYSHNLVTAGSGIELGPFGAWSLLAELVARSNPYTPILEGLVTEIRPAVGFTVDDWAVRVGGGATLLGADEGESARLFAIVSFNPFQRLEGRSPATTDRDVDTAVDQGDWCPGALDGFDGRQNDDGCPNDPAYGEAYDPADHSPATGDGFDAPSGRSYSPRRGVLQGTTTDERFDNVRGETDHSKLESSVQFAEIEKVFYFDPNEMHLDAEQLATIDAVAERLKASPETRIIVEGHSDGSGPWRVRRPLSRARASTVRYYLIQRGISWRRIEMASYGASRPAAVERTAEERALNRRVEIRVITAEEFEQQ